MQEALAALEFQTRRATNAEAQRDAWKVQADEWQKLYMAERDRAKVLEAANEKRSESVQVYAEAAALAKAGFEKAQARILELERQNELLKKSRWKWLGAGALGAAALIFSR